MGSIYWAELYFRSLKRTKVLAILTKYLLQYRRLSIPHVGTFELVQQPAEFNVVDKLIQSPSFHLNWHGNDSLPEHQLSYLAACVQADKEKIREELDSFGKTFKKKVSHQAFSWNGVGTLSNKSGAVFIERENIKIVGLDAVPANKLIRENVQHSVLVGDHQMSSQQVTDTLASPAKRKSYAVLIGWILFILAVLAIIFVLYKGEFNPLSSGLKMKASSNALY